MKITTGSDTRRAAALMRHHALRDVGGINAIFAEADRLGRVSPLVIAILQLHEHLVPELRTESAIAWMQEVIMLLASSEDDDEDDDQ